MSIPSSNKYPEFVPDQLLTSEHLNNLFAYADSEVRATRSRLIGIGIVCGLEVRADATSITISKGCGITTAGYLVRLEEDTTYTHLKSYDPLTEHKYDRFLNGTHTAGAFKIDELIQEASIEGAAPLTAGGMKDKAVLMFVELLAEGAKNCDPTSCDDKGVSVTVSYKPMLVDTSVAQMLLGGGGTGDFAPSSASSLAHLRMPRYDVPATPLVNAAAVLNGFRKVLTPAFLKNMQEALSKAYGVFSPLVSALYPNNPFDSLAQDFVELYDDLDTKTMLALQYHYDLFSDLMLAHDELRRVGENLLAICCPDKELFPRHLVLGAVAGGGPRHEFHPSAALAGEGKQVADLRLLFRRLVLLVQRFSVPAPKQSGKKVNAVPIRITPSQWGTEPLSARAIPFYYRVAQPVPALFAHWSAELSRRGKSNFTLSYHAADYNNDDSSVTKPLAYDLEAYDFLRIEGHVGQKMPTALASILKQKAESRLPFEVVALGADLRNVSRLIRSLVAQQRASATSAGNTTGLRTTAGLLNKAAAVTLQAAATKNGTLGDCHVQDLEAIYDTLRAELECILCCEMQYFYDIEPRQNNDNRFNAAGTATGISANATATLIPAVPLLKKCAPGFRYKAGSLGQFFEALWPSLANVPYKSPDEFLLQLDATLAAGGLNNQSLNKDVLGLWLALYLLYYIERLWEIMPAQLSVLDILTFATRYEDLMQVARAVKELIDDDISGEGNGNDNPSDLFMTEDVIDHLDALIYAYKDAAFEAVYREYLLRYMRALLRQKFGFFADQHPGIQHKAGVPMGGTFILVYHEAEIELEDEEDEAQTFFASAQAKRDAFKNFFQAKKAEATGKAGAPATARVNEDAASKSAADAAGAAAKEATAGFKDSTVVTVKETLTYSKVLAEGDARAMAFFEKYAAALRIDEDEDTTLQDLLDELPDGTIIADFCLPYLCCSDCPPIQFVVRGGSDEEPEPEPEKPMVSIEQKDYCGNDSAQYNILVTPAGGKLEGECVDANKLTFQPSLVALPASASSKDVPISYTTKGGTDSKVVTVFAMPDASFKPNISAASPLTYTFEDTSVFAGSWEWSFGDGRTSTEQNPQHTYQKRGETVVTLTVQNGPCRDITTQTIFVGANTEPTKPQCAPLAAIITDFESLHESLGRTGANNFAKAFEAYPDVRSFFQQVLPELEQKTVADQIESLAENGITDVLMKWLEQLNVLIIEAVQRPAAMRLYNLLARLIHYIACIQSEDINKARVPTDALLKMMLDHFNSWGNAKQNFTPAEKQLLEQLSADFADEATRAKARGGKPRYEKILASCISALKA